MDRFRVHRDIWTKKGSISRSTSRSRSASGSRSRSDWGGEAASRDGPSGFLPVAEPVFDGSLHKLLPADNQYHDLEIAYVTFTQQTEMGPATAYAGSFGATVKPEFVASTKSSATRPLRVWTFDESSVLWSYVDFATWAASVGDVCQKEITSIVNRIHARAQFWAGLSHGGCEGDEADNKYKAWKACHAVALRAYKGLSWIVINHIAEAAAVKLRDDAFFQTLDVARDAVSFRNGVVDLRTGGMRARTQADRLTYVLPYDYDSSADQTDIRTFIHKLFEDEEAELAFHAYLGYMLTGQTEMKMFMQFSSRPHAGKSTLLYVLSIAMGKYCSYGEVPLEELSASAGFEGTILSILMQRPPVRLLAFDETHEGVQLNESVVNQMTSGLSDISLTLRSKHQSGIRVERFCSKLVVSSNHVLNIPSSSSGTAARVRGAPFRFEFVPAATYDPDSSPSHVRPADEALISRLRSQDGRAGVAAYLVQGAISYYFRRIPPSIAWDSKTFDLRCDGDAYVKWIARNFTPTGNPTDRLPLIRLIDGYVAGNKYARNVEDGIRSALQSMSSFVTFIEWEEPAPFYNTSAPPAGHPAQRVVGISGLTTRMVSHPPKFADSIAAAMVTAADFRRAGVDPE